MKLPASYLILLKHSNGGCPEINLAESNDGSISWSINRFFHLNDDKNDPEGLWNATKSWRSCVGRDALPIGGDGGGNLFFINTSSAGDGAVKICVHDDYFAIHMLAPSFEEFIDRLTVDPDFI